MNKTRVLFVCMGNICRSPAAEGVLRALVKRGGFADRVEIASAGTIGLHAGELPDSRMRSAAAKRGYTLTSRARKFAPSDFKRFDLILTMDEDNRRDVLNQATTDADRQRVRPFVEFCRKHRASLVPDPYYGGPEGFERVLDLLEDGCAGILDTITQTTPRGNTPDATTAECTVSE
mgnify:CR=1 FL=1|jgi:Protein-tyrosine-phosphatase